MPLQYILLILGFILMLLGVSMIYSARKFVTKNFPKGDVNNATKGLKILGIIVACVGLFLAYFNI